MREKDIDCIRSRTEPTTQVCAVKGKRPFTCTVRFANSRPPTGRSLSPVRSRARRDGRLSCTSCPAEPPAPPSPVPRLNPSAAGGSGGRRGRSLPELQACSAPCRPFVGKPEPWCQNHGTTGVRDDDFATPPGQGNKSNQMKACGRAEKKKRT